MRAAILGMGRMGKIHQQVYESLGIPVIPHDGGDATEAIRAATIVSVCSPDNFHATQVIQALDMGKDVFCEKPLCHTKREFEAIKAAYAPRKCALGMNFPLRYHPPFLLPQKDVGDVYLVEAAYEYGRREKMEGWRIFPEYSLIMGGGIHLIDIMYQLGYEIHFGQSFSVGNYATVVAGRMKNWGLFRLTCDFGGTETHSRRLKVCGTKGSFSIDDREPTDKGRALKEFLSNPKTDDSIFTVHEIGLSL